MPPLYTLPIAGNGWRLLWWMIARMDSDGVVRTIRDRRGWRQLAADEIGVFRTTIFDAEIALNGAGLIDSKPREREARVLVRNLVG